MKKLLLLSVILALLLPSISLAATEQDKQQAIDDGLAWLAGSMTTSGSEGYWSHSNDGTLAATASAALAFIEEGYLPGDGSAYGDTVEKACNYIFNRGKVDTNFGVETAGYERYAEDYNNDGDYTNDGGNNQAIFFDPANYKRDIYTNGIVAPVIYALGEAYGENTVIGRGSSVVSGMTYKQALRDLVDWYSYGQVEPNMGDYRGGWRYTPNYSSSDNSTAQWGALTMLYGETWGLSTPDYVKNELKLWTDVVQNDNGGSGYDSDSYIVNVSKTGGLLLQFKLLGYQMGVDNSTTSPNTVGAEVDAALNFINQRWNNGPSSTWYGNIGHPYAMWAVYKALELWDVTNMSNAPGGFNVGQNWDPQTSLAGDWYAHYCDWLVDDQNANGSWNGYSYWDGALGTGWYINILNAAGVPEPHDDPVPEPTTMILFGFGLLGIAGASRQRRN